MRAGRLDRVVAVQQRSILTGDSGEDVEHWTTAGTLLMGKRDVRAAERFSGVELRAEIDTVFTARFVPGFEIKADTHRLVYRNTIYQIHGVTELGRREAIELPCSARGEAVHAEAVA